MFALFCGGLIKGTLGVGTPLLTVPMMTLVLPAQVTVILMAIPIVAANVWQAFNAPNLTSVIKRFRLCGLGLVTGTFCGISILSTINDKALLALVGSFVIALTFLQTSTRKLIIRPEHIQFSGLVFGFLAGVIGGFSSMFGPLLILYLVSINTLAKEEFVCAISFLYLCAILPWVAGLMASGLMNTTLLIASTLATIPVLAGLVVGELIRKQVNDQHFQRLIIVVLVASGLSMLWQSAQ